MKEIKLDTLSWWFFLGGIFFLPFNSYQGLGFLGEFSRDSCVLFFLIAAGLVLIHVLLSGKLHFPIKNPIVQILLVFLGIILLGYVLNLPEISNYYFKKTSGNNRFARQLFAYAVSAILLLFAYYQLFRNRSSAAIFTGIRKVLLWAFAIVSAYTLLELLVVKLNVSPLAPVLELFDFFPFTEVFLDMRNRRISSVTFEPPAFALYLITIAGWMFSYMITHRGPWGYLPGLGVLFFGFLSGSRAALLILFVQALVFVWYLFRRKRFHRLFKRILLYTVVAVGVVVLLQGKRIAEYVYDRATSFGIADDQHAVSNKSRFGIQYTLGLVFLESPLYGVGLGQQAFIAKDLYPSWATKDNWEFRVMYLNEDHPSFPPGFNIYLRILAELGIIGILTFIFLLVSAVYIARQMIRREQIEGILGLVLLVSLTGYALNWLKMDTFRIYGFWISLALMLALMRPDRRISADDEK